MSERDSSKLDEQYDRLERLKARKAADRYRSLEARVAELEADLTTLREYGTLDPDLDRDDRLGELDRELSFVGAIQYPPPPHHTPAAQPEYAAHAAAWVMGGGE